VSSCRRTKGVELSKRNLPYEGPLLENERVEDNEAIIKKSPSFRAGDGNFDFLPFVKGVENIRKSTRTSATVQSIKNRGGGIEIVGKEETDVKKLLPNRAVFR